jgi:hypothetical protein
VDELEVRPDADFDLSLHEGFNPFT